MVDVLMVEDNRGDIVLVQEAVTKVGVPFRIHVVRDGVEALQYLRRQDEYETAPRPAFIVLDLKLPRKGGREVLEELRTDEVLRDIPVILLSSSRSELGIARANSRPQDRFMTKPSTFSGYLDLVHTIEAFYREIPIQPRGEP